MAENYGSGMTLFTDGSTKQVLELGNKVHYFNPSASPLFTLMGRSGTRATPVPKFEWMEDEHFLKRTLIVQFPALSISGDTSVIGLNRQAQMEGIEVGNVYKCTPANGATIDSGVGAVYMAVVAHGQSITNGGNLDVDFVSGAYASNAFTKASPTVFAGFDPDATLSFEYIGTCGYELPAGALPVHGSAQGYAEGADVQKMSMKKVRRLFNVTQIFREPYSITRTAQVSKQYGEQELARLQARKLAKIKGDIEYAMLTSGDVAQDSSSEAPQRTFSGFGIGQAAGVGVIKSNDGRDNADFQWDESAGIDALDSVVAAIFQDTLEGSLKKVAYCSNKWLKLVVKAVRGSAGAQFSTGMGKDITAGLRVSSYMGPVGQIDFIQHPFLEAVHEDYALVVDFSNCTMRPLAQSNMQLRKNIVRDGHDGQTDEWLFEGGPEIRQEQTHAILKVVA